MSISLTDGNKSLRINLHFGADDGKNLTKEGDILIHCFRTTVNIQVLFLYKPITESACNEKHQEPNSSPVCTACYKELWKHCI